MSIKYPNVKQPVKFKELPVPFTIINGKKHFGRSTLEDLGIMDWINKYNLVYDIYTDSYHEAFTDEELGTMVRKQRELSLVKILYG